MKKFDEQIMELLQEAFDKFGYSGIQSETGIRRQNFQKWLSGEQYPSSKLLGKVADLMGYRLVKIGVDADQRMTAKNFVRQDDGSFARKIDLSQYEVVPVVKDPDTLPSSPEESHIPDKDIQYPAIIHKSATVLDENSPNIIGVMVDGEKMGTPIEKSDSLFFDREDREIENGRVYLVRTPDGQTLIRRVIASEKDGDLHLTFYAENPSVEPLAFTLKEYDGDINKAILGRGAWFRGNLREI